MSQAELARRTDKVNGSKFLPGTTLERIVQMTREILEENGAEVGSNDSYGKIYDSAIGISRGVAVRAVRVRRSNRGRYAHAYPDDEKRL